MMTTSRPRLTIHMLPCRSPRTSTKAVSAPPHPFQFVLGIHLGCLEHCSPRDHHLWMSQLGLGTRAGWLPDRQVVKQGRVTVSGSMCLSPGTLKSSAQAKEADWGLGVIREGMGSKGEVVIMAQGKAQLCPHGSDPPAEEPSQAPEG